VDADRERRARNEALFREVNERVEEVSSRLSYDDDADSTGFVCECSREDCTELIEITYAQYEAIRSDPRRFFLCPGHEDLKVDRVVERHARFLVVEKIGEASEIAVERDPRS
jgi:hypothetical protein